MHVNSDMYVIDSEVSDKSISISNRYIKYALKEEKEQIKMRSSKRNKR